jgi:hypothetical protein
MSEQPYSIPDTSKIDLGRIYKVPGAGGGAGGQREPDYIPFNKRGRDIFSRVSYNTGVFWLGGFAGGGLAGIREGLGTVPNATTRVKINAVINGISRTGAKVGNALGVIAFAHTILGYVADEHLQLEHYTGSEYTVPAFAGFATGLLYKSTSTPRAALLAGCIGLVGSVAYSVGGGYLYSVFYRKGRY